MSIQEIEAKEFQDQVRISVEQHKTPYLVDVKGIEYLMLPEVFNPNYAKPALLLLDNLGVKEGDEVLDPFTGSGVDAIFAVLQGASRAVAIDKFPNPCECARRNAYRLGIEDKIDVRQGNVFKPLRPGEKFDLVVANPPFGNKKPGSNIEAAMQDEYYMALRSFWCDVKGYLKPGGRVRVVFSSVGDWDVFESLIEKNGFESRVVTQDRYASQVDIYVFEATPQMEYGGQLENLRKVKGFSFEEVLKNLDDMEVRYKVYSEPKLVQRPSLDLHYFRESCFEIHAADREKVISVMPEIYGRSWNGSKFVRAYYEIQPGFDFKNLKGGIVFEDGLLVERVEFRQEVR